MNDSYGNKIYYIYRKGIRTYNQDVFEAILTPKQDKALFVVCDGMGGHAMGDVAAETVCNAIASYWQNNGTEADGKTKVLAACHAASSAMDKRADRLNRVEMGTTLVLASIERNKVTVAHCGDSRCYLLRENEVVYQTEDHTGFSFGWEVVTRCFSPIVRSLSNLISGSLNYAPVTESFYVPMVYIKQWLRKF